MSYQALGQFSGEIEGPKYISFSQLRGGVVNTEEFVLSGETLFRSEGYVEGTSGYLLSGAGDAEFNDVTVRGTIEATAGELGDLDVSGTLTIGAAGSIVATGLLIDDDGLRVGSSGINVLISQTGSLWSSAVSVELTANQNRGYLRVGQSDTIPSSGTILIAARGVSAGPTFHDGGLYITNAGPVSVYSTLSNGRLRLGELGTTGAPSYTFDDDSDTGMYRSAANTIALVGGGVDTYRANATQVVLPTVKDATTASAANMYIQASNGLLYRSTSSLKYKPDWEHVNLAYITIPDPIQWTTEDGQVKYGFGAEHIAEAVPEAAEDEHYDVRALTAILVAQVKELQRKVTRLESQLNNT